MWHCTHSRVFAKQGRSKGTGTAMKQPGAALYLSHRVSPPGLCYFPHVVFEVAFSQSYESLRENARHWLVRGQGSIKLAVLVKLIEGIHAQAEGDDAEAGKRTLNSVSLLTFRLIAGETMNKVLLYQPRSGKVNRPRTAVIQTFCHHQPHPPQLPCPLFPQPLKITSNSTRKTQHHGLDPLWLHRTLPVSF